jgi:hypothetical protein
MLQEEYIFNLIHLKQKKGCQLEGVIIVIYTNPFSIQQE